MNILNVALTMVVKLRILVVEMGGHVALSQHARDEKLIVTNQNNGE